MCIWTSPCLSVCLSARNNSKTNFHIWYREVIRKFTDILQFGWNRTKITAILHEDLNAFLGAEVNGESPREDSSSGEFHGDLNPGNYVRNPQSENPRVENSEPTPLQCGGILRDDGITQPDRSQTPRPRIGQWGQKLSRHWCRSQRSKIKFLRTCQNCYAMWPFPNLSGVLHALAWDENTL
jgi:hypothetical protein